MVNSLLKKFRSFRDFSQKEKIFEKVLEEALNRNFYSFSDKTFPVTISKEVRSQYFNLFKYLVGDNLINHSPMNNLIFPFSSEKIGFNSYSDHNNGCTLKLDYLLNKVSLEISDYSFNGSRKIPQIREIGLITTEKSLSGEFTKILVGDNFKYDSGYSANHSISKAIYFIQRQEIIPKISKSCLDYLKKTL